MPKHRIKNGASTARIVTRPRVERGPSTSTQISFSMNVDPRRVLSGAPSKYLAPWFVLDFEPRQCATQKKEADLQQMHRPRVEPSTDMLRFVEKLPGGRTPCSIGAFHVLFCTSI
jgi:hypothetical protein